jgi:excisionase family DNA binding protein
MRRNLYADPDTIQVENQIADNPVDTLDGLPNRLLTAFEVAEFVGCHEETVRRAYLRGLLESQRFGVRGRRFRPTDVLDWIRRGTNKGLVGKEEAWRSYGDAEAAAATRGGAWSICGST